jgi:ankyrin repeat protein
MEKFASLEQLLDDVPDVNAQVHGLCFIHMAVVHFQFEAVVLLQRKGADLNVRTHNGDTALHLTCQLREKQTESLRILRFLVSSSVHLDLRNESGETALFLAAG